MGYYIRILGTSNPDIHLNVLIEGLKSNGINADLQLQNNELPENWTCLDVTNSNGEDIIQIERNPVIDGELGQEELDEFREEIQEYRPKSAVKWLEKYFDSVRVIYCFQMFNRAFEDENYPIVSSIQTSIRAKVGGIIQSDYEGFTNEEGFYILWQFSDNVTGEWDMAVKNILGGWTNFVMDLGDKQQRKEFLKGKVPKNAKIYTS
jgi:hypothetical protein